MDDLRKFYEEKIPGGATLRKVTFGEFRGLTTNYEDSGVVWFKFWLLAGRLLVFATYNGTAIAWESDRKDVHEMLNTLRSRLDAPTS